MDFHLARKVPTYASDGRRLRNYSLDSLLELSSRSRVRLVRHPITDHVVSAHFRHADGGSPLQATANMGQRYSFLQHVGDQRAWTHTELVPSADLKEMNRKERAECERFVQEVFSEVRLSVIQQAPKPNAKVVPIRSPKVPKEKLRRAA